MWLTKRAYNGYQTGVARTIILQIKYIILTLFFPKLCSRSVNLIAVKINGQIPPKLFKPRLKCENKVSNSGHETSDYAHLLNESDL